MTRRTRYLLLLPLFATAFACGGSPTVTVEDYYFRVGGETCGAFEVEITPEGVNATADSELLLSSELSIEGEAAGVVPWKVESTSVVQGFADTDGNGLSAEVCGKGTIANLDYGDCISTENDE